MDEELRDFSYKDIQSVRTMFENMSESRIRRAMLYRESLEMASIELGRQFVNERTAIQALGEHLRQDTVCACPEPMQRRWHKVDRGEKISYSYDDTDTGVRGFALNYIREIVRRIESVCAVRFLECHDRNCDIHINWRELPGNILGSTIVPATGERMAACGPLCGDISMSTLVDWTNISRFLTVLEHEFYHALGVGHSTLRESIMFPSYLGVRRASIHDIRSLLDRYPLKEAIV